jgi:hypothetical protein
MMAQYTSKSNGKPTSGKTAPAKISSGQKSTVRIALATGATLAMLFSAQMFASGASVSTTTSAAQTSSTSSSASGATTTSSQNTSATTSQTNVSSTTNQGYTLLLSNSQPFPSTHSSR